MKTRAVVAGFEPFGGNAVNPSERMAKLLEDAAPAGVLVAARTLPVAYGRAFAPLAEALDGGRVRAALLLGLAAGRKQIEFERFAVNWRGGADPDNDGVVVSGEKIDPAGPAAYFASAPVDDLVAACRAAGAPSAASSHAGTFLCNQVFYQALRRCGRRGVRCGVAFAHLPCLDGTGPSGAPTLSEETMSAGLRAALVALVDAAA